MPIWNYNLSTVTPNAYWIDYEKLPGVDHVITLDKDFISAEAVKRDAAWQAWQGGVIERDIEKRLNVDGPLTNVFDNYRFIKKYFNPAWCFYIFLIRCLTLHNPFREFLALWKVRHIKRTKINPVKSLDFVVKQYKSTLLEQKPLVTIVIPTLNRYPHLKNAIHDLEKQSYSFFELIVIDQSKPFNAAFYKQFSIDVKVIRQEERALWMARNRAIVQSRNDYILLFDDDSRVDPDWIESHLVCLDYFGCDISSGVSISLVGAAVPSNYSYFRWGDQLDTGNAMIKRLVFEKVGLFDRQFERQRMGDGEFGLRAYLSGYTNVSNPLAKRLHLKVGEGGLREMGSWDSFRPKRMTLPRPVPSVLYLTRKYFGSKLSLLYLLQSVPPSIIPYQYKGRRYTALLGFLFFIIVSPVIVVQVVRSWRISSSLLKEGAIIDRL